MQALRHCRVKGTIGTSPTTTYIGYYFEWTGSTSTMIKYYYAGSTRVAMRTGSSTLNYLLGDHLGSQAITTSSSGAMSAEIRYYPWGTERYSSGTTPTTYHFTGQRLESALGLYYYGARWYDPTAGRFIQADTLIPQQQGVQAWDRYAYANNNPINYIDPTGHKLVCDKGKVHCNQEAQHNNISNTSSSPIKNKDDQLISSTTPKLQKVANSTSMSEPPPNGEELTNAQKIGKAVTAVIVNFLVLTPIEIGLIYSSITLAAAGPLGIVGDVILVPIELGIADLELSIAINAYESIESGHNVEFKWTLIPAVVSILPKPIQDFLHKHIPGVIP